MIDRIFSGAVTRGPVLKYGKMTYSEFVWFLISEEDKTHPRAIEYWFRCMDLDGDGFLSIYELEWFYTEQSRRLEAMGIEPLPFKDTLCQVIIFSILCSRLICALVLDAGYDQTRSRGQDFTVRLEAFEDDSRLL